MYSERIIQQNIERVERRERARRIRDGHPSGITDKFRLIRFPADVIAEMTEHLDRLIDKSTGKFVRDLTVQEQSFIENDLTMAQLDFRYWCENYAWIQLASQSDRPEGWDDADSDDDKAAGARIGRFILNGMQIQLLKKLARLEELCYEALARGAPVNGILLILHKARQLGASMMWQAMMFHRVNFYSHINALTASIDDKSTQALFRRFERILNKTPMWMAAAIKRQTREGGIEFERDSVIELQSGRQDKDLGKGETWHAVHITECAVFERPEDHFDEGLFAAIPTSLYTLYGMESTSKGKRGWWYDFVQAVMSGTAEGGAGRFSHYFAPFYLIDMADEARGQRSKYRIEAPIEWEPTLATQLMMKKVEKSSHQFCDVAGLVLHRDVAYWYESTRNYFFKRGKLNIFLQNYPVTPEESFQHSSAGAFDSATIERLELNCAQYSPWPYEIVTDDRLSEKTAIQTSKLRVYNAGNFHLAPIDPLELEHDRDPRGIIWLFEQPHDGYDYVLGCDPTGGIPGWRRELKQHNDINTDNGAIEVFRRGRPATPCEDCSGRGWMPTTERKITVECKKCEGRGRIGGRAIQSAEFAAPIDAEELALYVFVLGRIYRGRSDMDECVAVVESNNTGILTIRKLQTTYAYTNLYQTQSVDSAVTPRHMASIGFYSGPTTVPILHARSRSVVTRRDVDIRSPHLVKEYSDAIVKITGTNDQGQPTAAGSSPIVVRERFVVPPGSGRHDDRMTASFLAFWALFDWTEDGTSNNGREEHEHKMLPNLAARDVTAEAQQQLWNDVVGEYVGDLDLGFGHYPDCSELCTQDHSQDEVDENEYWSEDGEEGLSGLFSGGDDGGYGRFSR